MPSPLVLWTLSLTLAAIGMRRRPGRRAARTGGRRPLWLGVGRVVPVPPGLVTALPTRAVERHLAVAGLGPGLTVATVLRAQAALGIVALAIGGVAAITAPIALVPGAAAAALGVVVPRLWLRTAAISRRREIIRQLPDLIDIVVLCADAGVSIDPALRLAAQRLDGPCADEVTTTLGQVDLGVPRREAYRALAERVDAPQLTGLVGALLQAEELGTPIAQVLARHAELLRAARRQAVRDHAARSAPKVQLVVAMVMVPGALLVVVGVMLLQLIGQIGVVTGGAP